MQLALSGVDCGIFLSTMESLFGTPDLPDPEDLLEPAVKTKLDEAVATEEAAGREAGERAVPEPEAPITDFFVHGPSVSTEVGVPPELIAKRSTTTSYYHCMFEGCEFSAKNRDGYLVHVRDVHLRIILVCDHCKTYKVRNYRPLLKHIQTLHPEVKVKEEPKDR